MRKAFGLSDAATRDAYESMKSVLIDRDFDTFFDATATLKHQLEKVDAFVSKVSDCCAFEQCSDISGAPGC